MFGYVLVTVPDTCARQFRPILGPVLIRLGHELGIVLVRVPMHVFGPCVDPSLVRLV